MYVLMTSRSFETGSLEGKKKKISHPSKAMENLVDTLEVTFLKKSTGILLKFSSMIFRSSSKLGHV